MRFLAISLAMFGMLAMVVAKIDAENAAACLKKTGKDYANAISESSSSLPLFFLFPVRCGSRR